MSRFKQLLAISGFLLCLGLVGAGQLLAETPPVAKVGSVVITEDELQLEIQKRLPMVSFHGGIKPEKLAQIRQDAREELITKAYKVNYAMEKELLVPGQEIDADWAAFTAKNPGIASATKEQVVMLKELRHRDLLAKQAEELAVNSKVAVSDEAVKSYYEANKAQYFQGKLFKASHILVKVDPAEPAEAKEAKKQRAEQLLERAKAGEDFFNLAYYESDDRSKYVGGSLGTFHAGQTVAEFDAEIQKMNAGDIAGPVRTLYGYHIIKLDEVQEARQLTFEQSAEKVQARLKEEQRKKLYDEWMSGLKVKFPLQAP
jgi:parvulin-like peptidyl-prolyl isomerase